MSKEQRIPLVLATREALKNETNVAINGSCELGGEGHCITCSDEALLARVLQVDPELAVAVVIIADTTEEVDITLIDAVRAGDLLLVHGGVAIASVERTASNAAGEANDA
jgi:hydrogenase maturation factor